MNRSFTGKDSGIGTTSSPLLADFPPLSPISHSPSSSSPPRTRAKTMASLSGTISTRPTRLSKESSGLNPTAVTPGLNPTAVTPMVQPPQNPTTSPLAASKGGCPTSLSLDEMAGSPIAAATQNLPESYSPLPTPFSSPPPNPKTTEPQPPTWAEKFRQTSDKSLQLITPPSLSPEGIPRVKIPDSVFQKGAILHKDFIKGYFLGTLPH